MRYTSAQAQKLEELDQLFFGIFAPREVISVSEWADKHRVLSPESSESPGPWRTATVPYAREPMDCFGRPGVKEIILLWAAQCAKTEVILNMFGWSCDYKPGPTMFVYPFKDMAETDFSTIRLEPMIRDSSRLRDLFYDPRNIQNTKLNKTYRGGYVRIVGTAPAELASRPTKNVFIDELSRASSVARNGEGDIFSIAAKRTENYYDSKIVVSSTPVEEETCPTFALWKNSRQHIYLLPCPHCSAEIELKFEQIVWQGEDETTARYECQHCKTLLDDADKFQMLPRGRWSCTTPERSTYRMGYHLSALYSPWVPFSKVIRVYLDSKDNPLKAKTFTNLYLGWPYADAKETVDHGGLFHRRESYGRAEVPEGALLLTAGVDVNGSMGLSVEVTGWGHGEESWSVAYIDISGDPGQQAVWDDLQDLLDRRFLHAWGVQMPISAMTIDIGGKGGNHMEKVTDFVIKNKGRRVFAIKGDGGPGKPITGPVWRRRTGAGARRIPLFPIGVDEAKSLLYARLRIGSPGEGYCHFPMKDEYTSQYFKGLTVEKLVTKMGRNGFEEKVWVKPDNGIRNEPLDCRIYSHAALRLRRPDFKALERRLINLRDEISREMETGKYKSEDEAQERIEAQAREKRRRKPSPRQAYDHIFQDDFSRHRNYRRRRPGDGWQ